VKFCLKIVFELFTAMKLCGFETDCDLLSLSLRFAYGSVWETQVSVLSSEGLGSESRSVWKKCLSQSRDTLGVISLYGQGVVEGINIVFEGMWRQSAAILVWEHTSTSVVGASEPKLLILKCC
jgi:hypothetical protein